MTRVKSILLGLGIAVVAIAPWALVVMYAWANNTYGSPGHWATDWDRLTFSLMTIGAWLVLVFAMCVAVRSLRRCLRGWRLMLTSWAVALGGMFLIGATFVI